MCNDEYDKYEFLTNLTFDNAKLMSKTRRKNLKRCEIKSSEDIRLARTSGIFECNREIRDEDGTDFKEFYKRLKNEEGTLNDLKQAFDKSDKMIKVLDDDYWKIIWLMDFGRTRWIM